jgi:hypothetical protein
MVLIPCDIGYQYRLLFIRLSTIPTAHKIFERHEHDRTFCKNSCIHEITLNTENKSPSQLANDHIHPHDRARAARLRVDIYHIC